MNGDSDDFGAGFGCGFAVAALLAFAIAAFVVGCVNESWKRDSVKSKHAEYVADPNGSVKWKWKEVSE